MGFYEDRLKLTGNTNTPDRGDFDLRTDQPVVDTKFSWTTSPVTVQPDDAAVSTEQAVSGTDDGGTPAAYVVAAPEGNDTDPMWEADGYSTAISGSTPGTNPTSASRVDASTHSYSGVLSQADLAS